MKELSIEQKAIAYDKALERAKELYSQHWVEWSDKDIESIFPELKESEEEKIKKEIVELVMQPTWKTEKEFHRRKELCDWLEKQGNPED